MLHPGPYVRFHPPTATASFAAGLLAACGAVALAREVVDDVAAAPLTRLTVAAIVLGVLAGFAVNGYRNERWLARRGETVRVTVLGGADALLATVREAAEGVDAPTAVGRVPPGLALPVLAWHGGHQLPAIVVNARLIHQGPTTPPLRRISGAVEAAHRAVDPGSPDQDPAGVGW